MALFSVSYALNAIIPAATAVVWRNRLYLRPCFHEDTQRSERQKSEMAKRSPEVYHKQQETKYTSRERRRPFSNLIFIYSHIAAAPNMWGRDNTHTLTTWTFFFFLRSVHFVQDFTQLAGETWGSERHEHTHTHSLSCAISPQLEALHI